MKIIISKKEYNLISKLILKYNLTCLEMEGDTNNLFVTLNQDTAAEFREDIADLLSSVGFNEDYSPNEKGQILEVLIDKFYCG